MSIINLMRGALSWSPAIRMLLMALVPIAGASTLGVISEYATYNYAIHYGFRPAFEGVPYLKAAVSFISLFILVFGAIVFAGIVLIINLLVTQFLYTTGMMDRIAAIPSPNGKVGQLLTPSPKMVELVKTVMRYTGSSPLQITLLAIVIFSLIAAPVFYFSLMANGPDMGQSERIALSLGFTILSLILLSCMINRRLVLVYATLGAVLSVLVATLLMFNAPTYANFLRIVGYGGGIPIQIGDKNEGEKMSIIEGYLLLRTTDSFLVFDKTKNLITEYSRSETREISHAAGGLRRLPFSLPAAP